MTELLEKAMPNGKPLCVYAQLKTLPAEEQDAIASCLLAEMEDEQKWFASTTDEQWERMAEMVRQEIAAGDTIPLAEVFTPQPES